MDNTMMPIGKRLHFAAERTAFKYFRTRRLRIVYDTFGISANTRILDIGGTMTFWSLAEELGLPIPEVTIVNIAHDTRPLLPTVRWVIADAAKLPFPDQSFDFGFCNSVIEHVGAAKRESVAAEIMRVAKCFFVQTPNRGFFFEPHYLTPFIHWTPVRLRPRLVRWFTVLSWLRHLSRERSEELVEEIELLNMSEFKRLFPNAEIRTETFCGWTKSLMAIKSA